MDLLSTASAVIGSGMGGALVRGLFQVVGFVQKWQDDKHAIQLATLNNDHEFRMLGANAAVDAAARQGELDKLGVQGKWDVERGAAEGFNIAQEKASVPTGIRFIDGLNASMRPVGYYLIFGPFAAGKGLIFVSAMVTLFSFWDAKIDLLDSSQWALDIITRGYTPFDLNMIATMIGFIWADRMFARGFASTATRNV